MRSVILGILILFNGINTNAQEQFSVLLEPYSIPGIPGLQSFSAAQYDGKWVLVGGRTEGLHLRQPFSSFSSVNNNTSIYVVDPVSRQVWSSSVLTFPASVSEQLQSTNMSFWSDADKFYIAGGYGFSSTLGNHKTYPYLTVIDLAGLIQNIQQGISPVNHIRQIEDTLFAITGGQMGKIGDMFILAGGQKFNGRYNPNNGPSFTQEYSNQIRKFKILDNGTNIQVVFREVSTDVIQLHRRDYNMAPQVFPDRRHGYTMFSGVFQQNANLPFLNSVDLDTISYQPNNNFNQYLNHYHSAKFSVYDSLANQMHTIFFGGMAQYYYDAGGALVQDNEVPFVTTIGKVTRLPNGQMQENKIGDMPGLMGSGAEFIINKQVPHYRHEVFKLNEILSDTTNIGYLVGGITSTAPNIFFVNTGSQSAASNLVYKVILVKSSPVPAFLLDFNVTGTVKGNKLNWKTTIEQSVESYHIEHSFDGRNFQLIGAITPSGNTGSMNEYYYLHENPGYGFHYYRLKIIDTDGAYSYSHVVRVVFNLNGQEIKIYPNPSTDYIHVDLPRNITGSLRVTIRQVNGALVYDYTKQFNGQTFFMNTGNLKPAVYEIKLFVNKEYYQGVFVKN